MGVSKYNWDIKLLAEVVTFFLVAKLQPYNDCLKGNWKIKLLVNFMYI